MLGRPDAKFQPIPIGTVAASFVKALIEPKAIGRIFDLCGPETLTMPELLDSILEVMRRRRLKLTVPDWISWTQAAALEFVFPHLLRRPAPLNRDQLIMLREDNVGDQKAARELFGCEEIGFKQGISRYLT